MRKNRRIGFSILGFILFFLTLAVTTICSILVYYHTNLVTNGNVTAIVFAVLGNILFGTVICSVIDIARRKIMVDRPAEKILEATQKIAHGNFDVELKIKHSHKKFDEYDDIMENINIMTNELKKNEVLKTDFISNVSHEIKTPLAVIQNYSTILQDEKLSNADRQKYLKELSNATKRLSDLITNILKMSKLENQQFVPELYEFNLGEELRIAVLQFEELFDKKNIALECDIEDINIVSSKELLELVWNNLVSNAIKFTENKGKIAVNLKEEQGYAVVTISDTGCGISNEVGKHIFDKFYQGDTSHSSEGNGLGLALVKKVIDILGGEISVESEIGKGSTFKVKLKKGE